jgi:hypothetical protein
MRQSQQAFPTTWEKSRAMERKEKENGIGDIESGL